MTRIIGKNTIGYSYLLFSLIFAVGLCNKLYTFKIEYIHTAEWVLVASTEHIDKIRNLWKDDEKDLQKLCSAAIEHVVLDVKASEKYITRLPYLYRAKPGRVIRKMEERVFVDKIEPIIFCNIQPSIWLKIGELRKEFIILIEKRDCDLHTQPYRFEVSRIDNRPIPISTDNLEDEELMKRDNRLQAGVGACAWWYICEEAEKYTQTLTTTKQKNNLITRQLLQFNNDAKEKHVTLICPGQPATYAFFGDSLYDVKMKVFA